MPTPRRPPSPTKEVTTHYTRRSSPWNDHRTRRARTRHRTPARRPPWAVVITSLALFMATLDNLVVTTALPVIKTQPPRRARRARVDGERLHPHVRRAAAHRCRPRRPLRPPSHVPGWAWCLHRRVGRRRVVPDDRLARHRPGGAGCGGRARSCRCRSRCSRPRCAPERRNQALGLWGAIGGLAVAAGPARRRCGHERVVVAVHLLAQRPRRHRAGRAGALATGRVVRPAPIRSTSAGVVLATTGLLRRRPRPGAGQRARLDQRRRARRRSPSGALALAGFVWWELRTPSPMLPLRAVPQPGVRHHQRRRRCS